ncbi:LytR/AlgR family response regulator transcription factor [Actinomadura rupiterrae]|uniref:LytR/AlgR family response regulator transcription factor n=1 Tax=Actinomadura rupiterrae TaxID=559627 RepID=UPI0020A3397B|nr:LytTR family DNA-binding domain-containing protein [Actinomadura rupiterrae]MCP2341377.1 two-component system LytT family response regulator [Actinomadura rupiterrae]
MIRTLIVDDEPPARRRLQRMLAPHEDIRLLAGCGSPRTALAALDRHRPDLVFLDVQLPESDGFALLEAIWGRHDPAVVFVTAFSGHAVRAFEVDAVDYLLKPYGQDRLDLALTRVRSHLAQRNTAPALNRLPVETGGRIRLLDLDAIDYVRAEDGYLRIHTGARSHLVRGTLARLQERLGSDAFLRVHRSVIVRVDRIRELEILGHGEMQLILSSGETLISGRAYRDQVRAALGLPT